MFGWQVVLPVEVSSPTKENVLPKAADTDHENKDTLIDKYFLFHNKRLEKVKAKKHHNPDV